MKLNYFKLELQRRLRFFYFHVFYQALFNGINMFNHTI